MSEIPPRARGRVECAGVDRAHGGNTPACAGKSGGTVENPGIARKYPRVRGEESK